MASDPNSIRGAIAIVGMGGLFAGSDSPDRLWENVVASRDRTREVPRDRWLVDPSRALDPRIAQPDRVYTTRGGFVDSVRFDPSGTRLAPALVESLDPMFHLALSAASQAWNDALPGDVDRGRTGVILGNILLPTLSASALALDILGDEFARRIGSAVPSVPSVRGPQRVPRRASGRDHRPGFRPRGRRPHARRGLRLVALRNQAGLRRADRGAGRRHDRRRRLVPRLALHADGVLPATGLSPSGRAMPLDGRADGLVVGEGAGMFVLMRLADALRARPSHPRSDRGGRPVQRRPWRPDGARSRRPAPGDARGLRAGGLEPPRRRPDRMPCDRHAPRRRRRGREPQGTLGLPMAGGLASASSARSRRTSATRSPPPAQPGLLKVLLAMRHRTLPPTANFERPCAGLEHGDSPFRVPAQAEPWNPRRSVRPRRAAISGFGFGGINAHLLIEEWVPERRVAVSAFSFPGPSTRDEQSPIAITGIAAQVGPWRGAEALGRAGLRRARDRGRSPAPLAGIRRGRVPHPTA